MKMKFKALALLFVLAFTVSSVSLPAFAQPQSTSATVPAQADPNSLPEAGVPVENDPPAPSSQAKVSSSPSSKASSKPPVSKRPTTRKNTAASSSVSSALSSALTEVPSGTLPSSSMPGIILPTVSVESGDDGQLINSEIVPKVNNRKPNWIGIIAWICIALGVIVVVIVILSNLRPPNGGSGRKRYRRPRKSKKHLLNDRYYRNLKY